MTWNNRRLSILALGIATFVFSLPLIHYILSDKALHIEEINNGASINIHLENSQILIPGQCVYLSLQLEQIQAVWVMDEGTGGYTEHVICNVKDSLPVRVAFMDASSYTYMLPVTPLYLQPFYMISLLGLLAALCLFACILFDIRLSLAILSFFLVLPVMSWNSTSLPDYLTHILRLTRFANTQQGFLPPQLLFHISTIALAKLSQLSFLNSAILLTSFCQAVLVVGIYQVLAHLIKLERGQLKYSLLLAALALVLSYIGPVDIGLDYPEIVTQSGFIYPNRFDSPTLMLLRPLAVFLFYLLISLPNDWSKKTSFYLLGIFILTVLGTLAKPNYTLVIVPAYLLILFLQWLLKQKITQPELTAFAALLSGAVIALGWQYLSWFGLDNQASTESFENIRIVVAPFLLYRVWHVNLQTAIIQFFESTLFPVLVYLLYFRNALRARALNLAWIAFGGGVMMLHLFAEVPRTTYGNFKTGPLMTLLVLFVVSAGFLLEQVLKSDKIAWRDWRFLLASLVFFAHLAYFLAAMLRG